MAGWSESKVCLIDVRADTYRGRLGGWRFTIITIGGSISGQSAAYGRNVSDRSDQTLAHSPSMSVITPSGRIAVVEPINDGSGGFDH